jgi:hypothetical protein
MKPNVARKLAPTGNPKERRGSVTPPCILLGLASLSRFPDFHIPSGMRLNPPGLSQPSTTIRA